MPQSIPNARGTRATDIALRDWSQGGVFSSQRPPQTGTSQLRELSRRAEALHRKLAPADRPAKAAVRLVAQMAYAQWVFLDGLSLPIAAFNPKPEGHERGSLNPLPAQASYPVAHVLTSTARSLVMNGGCAGLPMMRSASSKERPYEASQSPPNTFPDAAGHSTCEHCYDQRARPDTDSAPASSRRTTNRRRASL